MVVNYKVFVRRINTEHSNLAYLLENEINAVIKAARQGGRHGLRVSDLAALRWGQLDLTQGLICYITLRKNGVLSVHPLRLPELCTLRRLQRDYSGSPYVSISERKAPWVPVTAIEV